MECWFRELLNFISGATAFIIWVILVKKNPEHALKLAGGCLLMMIGFAGRHSIIDIIKVLKPMIQ